MPLALHAWLTAASLPMLLHSGRCESSPQVLDMSILVQVSVAKTEAESLNAQAHFPIMPGGPGGGDPKAKAQPEIGFHKKMLKALPVLEVECPAKLYTTKEDCGRAVELMKGLINATEGPEPAWTWHAQVKLMIGLSYWLYTPGTPLCFALLDKDQSGGISFDEMVALFGSQLVNTNKDIWNFMDQDANGTITREELHKYLRAVILIREQLPSIDDMDPTADTKKCLNMAQRVMVVMEGPARKLGFYPKLLSIGGIILAA
eukprot:CAMPEP_0168401572 /NCGR_PEP_ID=MMETSP0228-20121227/23179_1 /TAXON_ID=133427 /ORGANISM="Protoceratium reticulatum, Strain CCCM 535 (=CCMP 1889)" /LENGTH=259 /DNA_ID=CAMNT_0008415141 /DNA_START=78 /DNA_END=853 /DNA_ORIENTATION=-